MVPVPERTPWVSFERNVVVSSPPEETSMSASLFTAPAASVPAEDVEPAAHAPLTNSFASVALIADVSAVVFWIVPVLTRTPEPTRSPWTSSTPSGKDEEGVSHVEDCARFHGQVALGGHRLQAHPGALGDRDLADGGHAVDAAVLHPHRDEARVAGDGALLDGLAKQLTVVHERAGAGEVTLEEELRTDVVDIPCP